MRPRLITRSITRPLGIRTSRADPRPRRIESLAAEFALLAQRRARMTQQIDLLDQQREAAAAGFKKLQAQMAWLTQKISALDSDLRDSHAEPKMAEPPPAAPTPQPLAHTPARNQAAQRAPAAPNRNWTDARMGANKSRTS